MSNIEDVLNKFTYPNKRYLSTDCNDKFSLPIRTPAHFNSDIDMNASLRNSLNSKYPREEYPDVEYIPDLFNKIRKIFEAQPNKRLVLNGLGYTYPSYVIPPNVGVDLSPFTEIYNKSTCLNFAKDICFFDNNVINSGLNRVKTYILSGYVGSGKTSFTNHVENFLSYPKNYKEEIDGEKYDAIVRINYDQFTRKIINNERDNIIQHIIDSINNSLDNNTQSLIKIIKNNNLLIIFDGFDKLTVNDANSEVKYKKTMDSLISSIEEIQSFYGRFNDIGKECHILLSLRKCTYDFYLSMEYFNRILIRRSYYLHAASFNSIISDTIRNQDDYRFISKHKDILEEIIIGLSKTIDIIFSRNYNSNLHCVFDKNYRRRLKFISTLVKHFSLELVHHNSSMFHRYSEDPHEIFLNELYNYISKLSDSREIIKTKMVELMIFGSKTHFSNYFSENKALDNRKNQSMFDNIFCYSDISNDIGDITVKIKILLFLQPDIDSNATYFTLNEIKSGLNLSSHYDLIKIYNILSALEQSLFVRSSKCYEKSGYESILFKCSEHGNNLLRNILTSYDYLSAVCQVTRLPEKISKRIKFSNRNSRDRSFMLSINDDWKHYNPANLLLFLDVINKTKSLDEAIVKSFYNNSFNALRIILNKESDYNINFAYQRIKDNIKCLYGE